jgi:Flp pilus assembly CpaE family ATPase
VKFCPESADHLSEAMLSAVLIAFDTLQLPYLRALVQQTGLLQILREINQQPTERELIGLMNSMVPDIWLLDLGPGNDGLGVAKWLRQHAPTAAIVGFNAEPQTEAWAVNARFCPILPADASTADLHLAVRQAVQDHLTEVQKHIFCFLPSKAGAGSSTIVLNTAAALARLYSRRVLVIDADLRSGVLGILLGETPATGIETLLMSGNDLELHQLQRAVVRWQGVDLLCSRRSLDAGIAEWDAYVRLIQVVRDQYDVILADLPELVNPSSVELVRRAQMVYPVCTTELASLKLTQQRAEELARWQVPPERVGVLINRWQYSDPTPEEIARLLNLPVLGTFPNDYPAVRDAVATARPVADNCELGEAYAEFAAKLTGEPAQIQRKSLVHRLMRSFGR